MLWCLTPHIPFLASYYIDISRLVQFFYSQFRVISSQRVIPYIKCSIADHQCKIIQYKRRAMYHENTIVLLRLESSW